MRQRQTALKTAAAMLTIGLIVCGWLLLGPRQLGGPATYAVIEGNSMEPMLHANDLAIVRDKGSYEVGDVVAYHSAELDRLVLHRIVERDGQNFILQGDNNDFLGSAQPSSEQIAGELALRLPRAGQLVKRLRSPAGFLILLGLGAIVLRGGRRRRGTASESADRGADASAGRVRSSLADASRRVRPEHMQTVLGVAGGAVVLLALVSALAYSRPTVETVEKPDLYEQTGTFSYSAEVDESPAYDSTTVGAGEAIFTSLVDEVEFTFDYRVASDAPRRVSGSAVLVARVTDGKGLVRTLPIAESQEFSGDLASLRGTLSLRELESLVGRIEAATDTTNDTYFVTLAADVALSGRVGEVSIDDAFAPELLFRLDAARLALAQSGVGDDGSNALVQTQLGTGPQTVAATFRVLALEPRVETIRHAGVAGALLASLVLIGGLGFKGLRRTAERGVRTPRRGRSPERAGRDVMSEDRCVALADMDDLVSVATERGQLVLRRDRPDCTQYFVDDGSVRHEYTVTKPLVEKSGAPQTSTFTNSELGEWLPLAARFSSRQSRPRQVDSQKVA